MERSLRLLVVEDDPPVARALSRVLKKSFGPVTVATCCAEARAATPPFDCGVFDIDLPDGSGLELATELLDSEAVAIAVFFSASQERNVQTQSDDLGIFVHKSEGIHAVRDAIVDAFAAAASANLAAGAERNTPPRVGVVPPSRKRKKLPP